MRALPKVEHPDLLVGYDTSDDAGVFRVRADLALVQTVDLITPIVDDPYSFGLIAAANSLSDVYAMGGRPLTALNILCFPSGDLPLSVAEEILKGGFEKIREAGAVLVGGHSVKDKELKYGLAVTGTVHPDRVLTNRGARPGNAVILTKPLGTGVISTALKGGVAGPEQARTMIETAAALNRAAAEVMTGFEVHACTDITGFGLGGHLLEVARASRVEITIHATQLPLLPLAREYALQSLLPGGCHVNRKFYRESFTAAPGLERVFEDLVFDPQTSGGLAIFLPRESAGRCLDELQRRGVSSAALIGHVSGESRCGSLKLA